VNTKIPVETALSREFLLGNTLLRGLSGNDQEAILESGSLVLLKTRQKVYEADQEITEVLFPISSVLSVVAELENGDMIEVGTVGCEGVSAIPLLLGSTTSANESYCQVPGMAISISPQLFAQLQHGNPEFRKLLDRYLQAYINLLGQLAACNRLHSVYERCARWILMTHDRVKSDVLPLTHEYLGMMLGSRRSGVTLGSRRAGVALGAHRCGAAVFAVRAGGPLRAGRVPAQTRVVKGALAGDIEPAALAVHAGHDRRRRTVGGSVGATRYSNEERSKRYTHRGSEMHSSQDMPPGGKLAASTRRAGRPSRNPTTPLSSRRAAWRLRRAPASSARGRTSS